MGQAGRPGNLREILEVFLEISQIYRNFLKGKPGKLVIGKPKEILEENLEPSLEKPGNIEGKPENLRKFWKSYGNRHEN